MLRKSGLNVCSPRPPADVRQRYHMQMHSKKDIPDKDIKRSLTKEEITKLHNMWMNDVSSWMNTECLQRHNGLMAEAADLDKGKNKSKADKLADAAEKGKAGKLAKGAEKG